MITDHTRDIAEFLHSIGWASPCDAQWENLQNALPQIAALIAAAPKAEPSIETLLVREKMRGDILEGDLHLAKQEIARLKAEQPQSKVVRDPQTGELFLVAGDDPRPSVDQPQSNYIDSVALEASIEIMKTVNGSWIPGGSSQIQAKVQCIVIEALKKFSVPQNVSREFAPRYPWHPTESDFAPDNLYRKRPVVVTAVKWHGWQKGPHSLGITRDHPSLLPDDHFGWIATLEGGHIVTPGDWIITGVKGEKYPCKADIFEETYELVS